MKEQHPGLPRQRKRIAFITDAPSATSFTPRLLSGIALFIQKRRSVVLQQVPFTEIANDTLNGRFDGIISNLCATHTRNLLAMLNGASLPIVDTGAEIKDPSLIRVDIDIVREGTMAAEWFLRRGFRNFAYCGFHGVDTYPYSDILEGAFAAKRKKGLQRIMWIKLRYARPRTRRHGESPVGDWRRRFHGRLRGVASTAVKSPSPPLRVSPCRRTRKAAFAAHETSRKVRHGLLADLC